MTVRDLPRFQYHCSAGHELAASHPLDRCPAVVLGVPCAGNLERFGPGSRQRPMAVAS